jgi:hypothetical protein
MYEIIRDTNSGRDLLVSAIPILDVARLLYSMRFDFPTAYAVRVE